MKIVIGILAAIVGLFTWMPCLMILGSGIGPYMGGADIWMWLFFLAPVPFGIRLTSVSPLSGAWFFALMPIISALTIFAVAMCRLKETAQFAVPISIALLWLLPVLSNRIWISESKKSGNPSSHSVASTNVGAVQQAETAHTEDTGSEELQAAPIELLDAADVREFVAKASKQQVVSALSDRISVSRFFNAIRYGQITEVRRFVSKNPLLVLAKDAYGNSPITAAEQEANAELLDFFNACVAKP